MSKRSSYDTASRGHNRSSSNRVLRALTFVLTPFLILAVVCSVTLLAVSVPYSEIEPYISLVFETGSDGTSTNIRTLNKYKDDNVSINKKEVTDDTSGETHTMIYPYYGDFYATLNCEAAGMNDIPVYSGTTNDVLANGAGWYNGSVYIGNVGNVVLAGHNHTYFYHLPNCEIGDVVTLETDYCKLTYVVRETQVFHEDDTTLVRPTEDDILTMYTCWNNGKLGMSEYRLAVICDLTEREWKEVDADE